MVLFVRPQIATLTPSRARERAHCLPSPRLPPVTNAFLPAIPKSIWVFLRPDLFAGQAYHGPGAVTAGEVFKGGINLAEQQGTWPMEGDGRFRQGGFETGPYEVVAVGAKAR